MEKRALALLTFLVFIINLNLTSARNITINYPSSVSYGENFEVNLKLLDFPADSYDVKIDIIGNGKRISRILNNNVWKSTNYYVPDAIDETKEARFSVNITEKYSGKADFIVKTRNSKDSISSFLYIIDINYEESSDSGGTENINENKVSDSEAEESVSNDKPVIEEDSQDSLIESESKITSNIINNAEISEPIVLGKDIKSEKIWKSETRYIKEYSLVGFALFCIVALVVLLKYGKNNEKNKFFAF
jgi:hypothetical protein